LQASYLSILFPDFILTRHGYPLKGVHALNNVYPRPAAYYKLPDGGEPWIPPSRCSAAPETSANDVKYQAHRESS
jgi:hypothetical protein